MVTGPDARPFDVPAFIDGRGTIYLISPGDEESPRAPLFRCFTGYVHRTPSGTPSCGPAAASTRACCSRWTNSTSAPSTCPAGWPTPPGSASRSTPWCTPPASSPAIRPRRAQHRLVHHRRQGLLRRHPRRRHPQEDLAARRHHARRGGRGEPVPSPSSTSPGCPAGGRSSSTTTCAPAAVKFRPVWRRTRHRLGLHLRPPLLTAAARRGRHPRPVRGAGRPHPGPGGRYPPRAPTERSKRPPPRSPWRRHGQPTARCPGDPSG